MFRKKGILFLAVLVALVIGLGFIFTDKWLGKITHHDNPTALPD